MGASPEASPPAAEPKKPFKATEYASPLSTFAVPKWQGPRASPPVAPEDSRHGPARLPVAPSGRYTAGAPGRPGSARRMSSSDSTRSAVIVTVRAV